MVKLLLKKVYHSKHMELTIKEIEKKEIPSQDYDKWVIKFVEKDQYFDSFIGKWNSNWSVNSRITVEDAQWKEPNDDKYNWRIAAPASARGTGGYQNYTKAISDLEVRVKALEDKYEGRNNQPN